jgi:hypothetical protein
MSENQKSKPVAPITTVSPTNPGTPMTKAPKPVKIKPFVVPKRK